MYKEQLDSCECLLPVAKITNEVFEYQKIILPSEFFQEVLTGCLQILNTWLESERESESCLVMSNSLQPHGLYGPWNSPGQITGVGSLSLLQVIFLIQGLNPGIPRCRQILYQLSHKRSLRILEWVAYPFSSMSSQPRNRTRVFCTTGRFLPTKLSGMPWQSDASKFFLGLQNHCRW